MLDFINVTKKYDDGNIAVENLNFSIADGEFVFIVGSSGAGKSTIVRLMLNIEAPSEGQIIFNGIKVNKLKKNKLAYVRREIGVVFQDFKLLKQKTVYENIAFVLEVAREKKINIKKKVNDVLDLVGLVEKGNKFPAELSGGEQQRVAIARSLVNDPILLIADEPTGNLDSYNAWDTFQLINKVNNWGTTVIVVTHDNEIVDSLQKRVIQLERGCVIRDSVGGYDKYNESQAHEEYIHPDRYPDPGDVREDMTPVTEPIKLEKKKKGKKKKIKEENLPTENSVESEVKDEKKSTKKNESGEIYDEVDDDE